jgi:hypothetical protein
MKRNNDLRFDFRYRRLDGFPDHLRALGLLTTEWVRLEWMMGLTFMFVLGDARKGDAVWHTIHSFEVRADILTAAITEATDTGSFGGQFLAVLEKIDPLSRRRNTAIHGAWGSHSRNKKPLHMIRSPGAKLSARSGITSLGELKRLCDDVTAVINELNDLNLDFVFSRGYLFASSQDKRP